MVIYIEVSKDVPNLNNQKSKIILYIILYKLARVDITLINN